jgi:predicted homoserine dehydrogenase-like protein
LIGLEVGISIASVGLREEPTGCAIGFHADAVTTAKRDLRAGETLDGEGGYTVYGRLSPSSNSLAAEALPLGLSGGAKLLNLIASGAIVRWSDVTLDETHPAVVCRREMEACFGTKVERAGLSQ